MYDIVYEIISVCVYLHVCNCYHTSCFMTYLSPVTVRELAEKAGLPLQHLDRVLCEEHTHILAEFCDPWEKIGYHLKLTKANVSTIKDPNATTEKRRIAMLEKWKERFAHKATYRVLIKALIRSEHPQQAFNLCQKIKQHEMPASDHSDNNVKSVMQLSDSSLFSTEQKTDSHLSVEVVSIPDTGLAQSIDQLQVRFICIQNRFLQSGAGTGVTLERLQTCVSTLPSFTCVACMHTSAHSSQITKKMERDCCHGTPEVLLKVNSIELFMANLEKYCCCLNPDILEGLIEVLGDVETKYMMKEYNRDLHDFRCKTKLKRFIGNYNRQTPPEYKEVQLKLGDKWREKTLADIKVINSQISQQPWLLKMVARGSIHVTFMSPQVDDLKLGDHLRDYLKTKSVLQIHVCGEHIFNFEGTCK